MRAATDKVRSAGRQQSAAGDPELRTSAVNIRFCHFGALARPGRVVHVEVEPAVKPREYPPNGFPGGAEQNRSADIWQRPGRAEASLCGRPESSAGYAGGGAGGAECVP